MSEVASERLSTGCALTTGVESSTLVQGKTKQISVTTSRYFFSC
jgi:hypothetical protein